MDKDNGGCTMDFRVRTEQEETNTQTSADFKPLEFLREVLIVFCVVLTLNSFVLASFVVPTGSMENTVKPGDFLFVNKFIYGGTTPYTIPLTSIRIPHLRLPGFRSIKRGDVIVFDWPGMRDQVEKPKQAFYLKRCIGLPGDEIKIDHRTIFINGKRQALPPHGKYLRPESLPAGYPNPNLFPRESDFNEDNYGPITIPKKGDSIHLTTENFSGWEVFIGREGHRTMVLDDAILIDGHPTDHYTVERDYVFAMGDNRDNSLDSRFWGFVPVQDVIGTPMIVFWSWDPNIPITRPIDKILSIKPGRIGTILR